MRGYELSLMLCKDFDLLATNRYESDTMKPCRLKDCKVTSPQSWTRPRIDPGPPSSIAILAESDQAILIIFDRFERFDSYLFGIRRSRS